MNIDQQSQQPLPIPALNPEQVKWILDFAENELVTKHGRAIQGFIQNIAVENAKAEQPQERPLGVVAPK